MRRLNLDQWVFVGYLAVLLFIGYIFSKRASRSLEDFLLGGRTVGPAATAMTMQGTSMSGYMFMGGPALAYQQGWYALWYAIGDAGGAIVNISVLGKRMRRLSEILGALSPIEYLGKRYESSAVQVIASIISIIFISVYVFAQFIAAGKALTSLTGMSYTLALLIGVGVIIVYTVFGGYLAVVWTDFIQSIIMVVGVLGITIAAVSHLGGLTSLNTALADVDPTYLSIWGKDLAYQGQWGVVLGAILIYSIGYMGLPHVVVRHMSMKSPKTARTTILWAAVWSQLFVFAPYILGLCGIVLLPNLSDPEMVIPELAYTFFPGIFAALLLSAVMAAVMSTSDSLLMQAGTILSRDIYQRFIDKKADHRRMVLVSRLLILLVGIVGVVVAAVEPPTVFDLVIFGFGVLGDSFIVPYIASVYSKKANRVGAICSMVFGAVTHIVWTQAGLESVTAIHPFIGGLIFSILGMLIGNLFGKRPSQKIQDAVEEAKRGRKVSTAVDRHAARELAPEALNIARHLREHRMSPAGR